MADTVPDKVKDVLSSGYIGQGPKNEEFESQLRNYYGKSCVTVNSGTSGLSLIYNILDVEEYEHILTTPLTCFATNAPLITQDIPIRWVDVDYNTCQMSINDLRGKIRDTTRAVVLVSWGGYSLPYNDLLQIKDDYRRKYGRELIMIEDAAHSFGNPNLGTLDFTILSLQAIKHVTSVDGGVIIPKDEACVDDLQKLRWYGLSRRKWNDSFRCESDISRAGFKYHMNDVNSVIGMENLKHADWILNRHRRNMMWYDANLLCSHVELPQIDN
ncbi:MAG: DegT/DnrJ/EryC1/StrS family aminotransferase, partial [Saprospiraceae bacterium]